MYSFEITLIGNAPEALRALKSDLQGAALKQYAGRKLLRLVQDHFAGLESSRPNRLGGARSHFWADAARSTVLDADADGIGIGVYKTGVAQRRFGGTITPATAGALTIPVAPEAYGRRAREFNDLELVAIPGKTPFLVQRESSEIRVQKDRRKGREGKLRVRQGAQRGGKIFYVLVKSVTQQPDPSVLPADADFAAALTESLHRVTAERVADFAARASYKG